MFLFFCWWLIAADDFDYKEMIERDERRWAKADVDEDKLLNQEEFSNFLHPEDAAHMRDIVITVSITGFIAV